MSSISPDIVTDGLVLCLDAADKKSYSGSGTTWYDRSGEDNDGTLTGGTSFSSTNGGVLDFDGVDDYVTQGCDMSSFSKFSLCFWAKTDDDGSVSNSTQALAGNYPSGGTYIRMNFNGDKMYLLFNVNGNESSPYDSAIIYYTDITPTEFNYYTVTIEDDDTQNIYVNGILKSTESIGAAITTGLNTSFEAIGAYASYFWEGQLASCCIYNKKLSAAEVLQNFNAMKSRFGIT